jgi:hypothetical protein
MQSKFLIQQCLMAIAATTAIGNSGEPYDMSTGMFDLEFGRATHHHHEQDIADNEV